jgi:D-alanyl-D-alanine carboxypeptidase
MPTEQMSSSDAAAVDKTVSAIWQPAKADIPALYVGIWDPKKGVYTKAFGEAAKGVSATTGDSFRIGSITKTFTANVILQLVKDGKLSLDDEIKKPAPGVARKYPTVADRTLRQLLGMRSGISDYINGRGGIVKEVAAKPDRVWSADELIESGISRGVTPAGKTGSYSTTNYILLQQIAEEVSGSSLAELIKTKVTSPLGLDKTYLPPNDDTALPSPATHSSVTKSCKQEFADSGAEVKLGTDLTDWNVSYGQGGGGMTSTLKELGTWAASKTGDVLLPANLVKQRNTMTPLTEGIPYGLGVLDLGGWIGHEGEALGWETIAVKDPKSGVTVALAGNSCGISLTLAQILGSLYPSVSSAAGQQ